MQNLAGDNSDIEVPKASPEFSKHKKESKREPVEKRTNECASWNVGAIRIQEMSGNVAMDNITILECKQKIQFRMQPQNPTRAQKNGAINQNSPSQENEEEEKDNRYRSNSSQNKSL